MLFKCKIRLCAILRTSNKMLADALKSECKLKAYNTFKLLLQCDNHLQCHKIFYKVIYLNEFGGRVHRVRHYVHFTGKLTAVCNG